MDEPISKETFMADIANQLHKPMKKKYPVQRVYSDHLDETWSMDLVEMGEHEGVNDGFRYILTVIDLWSRYAWAIPLKNKTAKTVKDAFVALIKRSKRQPESIWVDKGSEFYNGTFTTYLKTKGMDRYSTYGPHKAVMIERFNRTLKTKMYKRFTAENTRRWVEMLPELVADYNSSKHSTIKMTPSQALDTDSQSALKGINNPDVPKKKRKVKALYGLGDSVRVSLVKSKFEKGYIANWSLEIFKIVSVIRPATGPVTYKLADETGERIDGSFYTEELQRIVPTNVFFVEEVLKTRKRKGVKELFVRWKGYPKSFDSWILDSDAVDV